MTWTIAILILLCGMMIGYHLADPLARLRERYLRWRFKPRHLRRYPVKNDANK